MVSPVLFSSDSAEWSTPQDFYNKLNAAFNFTLDPCATDENHKCDKYFTKETNGLAQSWAGHIAFMNPPYGRDIIHWIKKAHDESLQKPTEVIGLLPARTDTKWFHEYIYNCERSAFAFVRGRLKFGGNTNSAPFPSIVVYWTWEAISDVNSYHFSKRLKQIINSHK